MLYNLTNNFTRLSETTGTIQNSGAGSIEVSNQQTFGTGIILKPGEKFSFTNATLYARCEGKSATARVVPFVLGAGGVATISGGTDTSGDSTDYPGTVDDIWNDVSDPTNEMWNNPTQSSFDSDFDAEIDRIYGL